MKSDGYYHARITLLLIPVCAVLFLAAGWRWSVAGALGCAFNLVCGPDLDQEMVTENEWFLLRIPVIGWLIGTVWVALWFPYALLMPHRKASHTPVLGTVTRLAYLVTAYLLVAAAADYFWIDWWPPVGFDYWLLLSFVGGLIIADAGHWARDTFGLTI